MDGAAGVGRGQPGGQPAGDLQGALHGQAARRLMKRRTQARPGHVLHGDKQAAIFVLVQVNDLDDIRVAQLVSGPRLLAEALDELGVAAQFGGQELERQLPAQQQVLGKVDDAHPALAQLAHGAVLAAHDLARRKLPQLDQHGPVSGAVGVLVRIRRIANRAGFHLALSPASAPC